MDERLRTILTIAETFGVPGCTLRPVYQIALAAHEGMRRLSVPSGEIFIQVARIAGLKILGVLYGGFFFPVGALEVDEATTVLSGCSSIVVVSSWLP